MLNTPLDCLLSLVSSVLLKRISRFFYKVSRCQCTVVAMLLAGVHASGVAQTSDQNNGIWLLNQEASSVYYISIKKEHVGEVATFQSQQSGTPALSGSIDRNGDAVFAIDLNQVQTGIDIRDQRMTSLLFESQWLPMAYFSVNVDTDVLNSMPAGSSAVNSLSGTFTIHGVSQNINAQVMIVKKTDSTISVSALQPVLIDSKQFDLAGGLAVLRNIANLSSIGQVVPVYFNLEFSAVSDTNVQPVNIAPSPQSPSNLNSNFNADTANAALSWSDNSNNETGFIVRRKSTSGVTAGLWQTADNLGSDLTMFSEGAAGSGQIDYKVIAVNGSVPSAPSNITTINIAGTGDVDHVALGKTLYDTGCAGCHGGNGEGVGNFPALNTARDVATMIQAIVARMPPGNPGSCDQQCAEDIAAYIQTLWAPSTMACNSSETPVSYGARQLKILTKSEYQRSVRDLLGVNFNAADGLSADLQVGLFFNNTQASIASASYSNFLLVAGTIADWSADRNFSPAINCNNFDQSCASDFVNNFAPKVFRRPLTNDEVSQYSDMANGTYSNGDVKAGIKMALEALLSSPQFIYRHELGERNPDNPDIDSDAFELTSYEMATFLSYTFNGTTPDDELLNAAANDWLRNPDEILRQARRLTAKADASDVLGDFVASWLGTNKLENAAKDVDIWPDFADIVPAMKAEIRAVFANVMLDANEQFASLYDADYTFVNQALAAHYGISGVSGNAMQKVATSERGGVLANGAFMARWAESFESSPILRSVRVRRRMLCQDQPDPPAGTFQAREVKLRELSDLLQDPSTTNRLKYQRLTEDAPCSDCHMQYINPLGFGMEDFDTVGRVRTVDLKGNAINSGGALFSPDSYGNIQDKVDFGGARDLGRVLANLPSAQACIPKQMFRFVMGVGHDGIDLSNPAAPTLAAQEQAGYACEIDGLKDTLLNDSPKAMLESFSTLDAVRYRKAWPRN